MIATKPLPDKITILFRRDYAMCLPDLGEAGGYSAPWYLEIAAPTLTATVSKLVARVFRRVALRLEQWAT
jgi:hypothetical protein